MAANSPDKTQEMIQRLQRCCVVDPWPFVVDLERSHGMYLATLDGRELFDWMGYYGSKLITHNHPKLQESEYLKRLARAANNKVANPDFLTAECVAYYELLYELAPACMKNPRLEVYTVNSGAEAVENLMKYMINLHEQKIRRLGIKIEQRRFIYFNRAFHGRTVYALNVTLLEHDPIITKDFSGIVPGNIRMPLPHMDTSRPHEENLADCRDSLAQIEQALRQYGHEVVGIVVEPIQGAGGHRLPLPEFFRGLSELAHQYDVSLGFDEVQTAGGQCGTVFAVDQFDLPHPPQAIAVAKKFANGAVYMQRPMDDLGVLDSTWGGTLADMVRFVQEWSVVREEQLIEQVPAKAERLVAGLNKLVEKYPEQIFNVRGLGLYQGFTLRNQADKGRLCQIALDQEQTLLLGAGVQSIRLRPALDVSAEEIDLLLTKLDRCLKTLAAPA